MYVLNIVERIVFAISVMEYTIIKRRIRISVNIMEMLDRMCVEQRIVEII